MKARAALAAVLMGTGLVVGHSATAQADTTTQANDTGRTGLYADQSGLSPQVVTSGSFGQLFSASVNGAVFAQPLVADKTLIVATENDNAYGLDPHTGQPIWSRNFGTPFAIQQDPHLASCTDIVPKVGVTSYNISDPATANNTASLTTAVR